MKSHKLSARQVDLGQRFSNGLKFTDRVEIKYLGSLVLLNFTCEHIAQQFQQQALASGINIAKAKSKTLTLTPPLTITDSEVDFAISRINQIALNIFDKKDTA